MTLPGWLRHLLAYLARPRLTRYERQRQAQEKALRED